MTTDREHIVTVPPAAMDGLRAWLERPNGAHSIGRVTFEAVAHGGIFVRTRPYGQDAAPERPVSLQHDACGALLKIEFPTKRPFRSTLRCALGAEHRNMPHRAPDGTQWDTATPGATVEAAMDQATAAQFNELEQLAAPSEAGALNLGPIIERQRAASGTGPLTEAARILLRASQRDVMPLVREVMRLRRPKPAMPGDAVLRSALPGIARHIEDMRHVFAELLAATCTGCPIVANSSNPEDGADLEPIDGCPVHGEVAELRRSLDWSARQQDRIAVLLGPEYVAPFGPDVTTEVLRLIELGRQYEGLQR